MYCGKNNRGHYYFEYLTVLTHNDSAGKLNFTFLQSMTINPTCTMVLYTCIFCSTVVLGTDVFLIPTAIYSNVTFTK